MSTRRASWLAWSLCVLAVALSISTIPLVISYIRAAATPGTLVPPGVVTSLQQLSALDWTLSWIQSVMRVVPLLAFSALGALIVSRYPSHVIGWIFCALGVLGAVEPFAAFYAINALFVARGALPGGAAAGWLQNWIWIVSIALVCAFLPLHFPTGRLVSQRWRLARWVVISMTVAMALDRALRPGRLGNSLYGFDIPNPLGVAHVGTLSLVLFTLPLDLLHASMLAAAASLVVRLRHARGAERQQIKWFAYFGAAVGGLEVLQFGASGVPGLSPPSFFSLVYPFAWPTALTGLALASGVAILRYRLFDIDILIRRTLVYGTLTALLAAVYFGVVIGVQALVGTVNGAASHSPVIIVASTLLIAALFTPLRRGIQAVIDRRFYRRKYDAAKTLAAFGQTLRTETDLAELSEQLVAVVEETMQPTQVSLWLRAPARRAPNRQTEESPLSPSS